MAFIKEVGITLGHYLCRAEMIQLSFEAKADQIRARQQRMLHHHPGLASWPAGREIRTLLWGMSSPAVIAVSVWNMSCFMLMSHISSFPGVDAPEGSVVT